MGRNKALNNQCIVIYGNTNDGDVDIEWKLKKPVKLMSGKIKNALISLSDKDQITRVLKALNKYKINIISSGGTYEEIKRLGYKCTEISKYTKFKEMLDGRVKTLHPKIHAGILSKRSNSKHRREMNRKNLIISI